jgi:hypothetical protein
MSLSKAIWRSHVTNEIELQVHGHYPLREGMPRHSRRHVFLNGDFEEATIREEVPAWHTADMLQGAISLELKLRFSSNVFSVHNLCLD